MLVDLRFLLMRCGALHYCVCRKGTYEGVAVHMGYHFIHCDRGPEEQVIRVARKFIHQHEPRKKGAGLSRKTNVLNKNQRVWALYPIPNVHGSSTSGGSATDEIPEGSRWYVCVRVLADVPACVLFFVLVIPCVSAERITGSLMPPFPCILLCANLGTQLTWWVRWRKRLEVLASFTNAPPLRPHQPRRALALVLAQLQLRLLRKIFCIHCNSKAIPTATLSASLWIYPEALQQYHSLGTLIWAAALAISKSRYLIDTISWAAKGNCTKTELLDIVRLVTRAQPTPQHLELWYACAFAGWLCAGACWFVSDFVRDNGILT